MSHIENSVLGFFGTVWYVISIHNILLFIFYSEAINIIKLVFYLLLEGNLTIQFARSS